VNWLSFAGCQHRGVLVEDFERTRAFFGGNAKGCLLMLDLTFSEVVPEACPLRPFLQRMRDGSAQGQGAVKYVGRQVEVVGNALGCDASFSDFDLGHPGEPDLWRLAPELKFRIRPQLHWALQEESELAPTDRSRTGESVLQEIEVFVQRPAIEASDERISEPIARGDRIEDLFQVGLCPTFDVSIKW
jgi:hypothetical protein